MGDVRSQADIKSFCKERQSATDIRKHTGGGIGADQIFRLAQHPKRRIRPSDLVTAVAQGAGHGTGAATNVQDGLAACESLFNGLTLVDFKIIFILMAESAPVNGGNQVKQA